MQFVADLEPTEDGSLQIMYGIDGRRDLTESTRDDLSGYAGARAGADRQRRLRPAPERRLRRGARLDPAPHAAHSQRLPRRLWPIVQTQAECATSVWREPDQGIWEARGKPAALRLLEADVLGRARPRGQAGRRSAATRQLQANVAGDRRRDPRGHPRARRDRATASCASTTRPDALDASTLLGRDLRLPAGRRRASPRKSVDAIADESDRGRLRAALPDRRDRRRPLGQGGDVPDLLVLARLRARRSSASCSAPAT